MLGVLGVLGVLRVLRVLEVLWVRVVLGRRALFVVLRNPDGLVDAC